MSNSTSAESVRIALTSIAQLVLRRRAFCDRLRDVLQVRGVGPADGCGRRPLAEEIVQDAFMSLWRSTARYDASRGSVRSWVLKVVHNRAIDAFRRELPSASHDVPGDWISEVLPARERTEDEVQRRSDARLVRSALEELPGEQRQVIELAYFGGFSHGEIATALGLPPGTVKGRMRLGLSKLRIALGEPAGVLP